MPERLDQVSAPVIELVEQQARVVRSSPGNTRAWGDMGMVYEANLLPDYAIPCYREALQRTPQDAQWWHRLAVASAATGDTEAAITAMRESLRHQDSYPPSYWKLGSWLFELGELEQAEETFQQATRKAPDYPGGWAGLARVQLQLDQPQAAIRNLQRVLARQPDAYSRQLLGAAYRQAGQHDTVEARSAWDASREPPWPDPWERECQARRAETPLMQARRLSSAGKTAEAIDLLEELSTEPGDQVRVLSFIAQAHYANGDAAKALAAFERILEVEPRNVWTLINIARIHENVGDPDAAVAALDRAIPLRPDYGTLYATKGRLLFQAGRHAEAIPCLGTALERDERDVWTRTYLGLSLARLERWPQARDCLAQVAAAEAPPADALIGLAQARLALGEVEEAAQTLSRAETLGPRDLELLAQVRTGIEAARDAGPKQ